MANITVVSSRRSEIGESPFWDHRINRLLYVDIFQNVLSRLDPETQKEDIIKFADDEYITLVIPLKSDPNKLLISRNKQLCQLQWDTKEISVCAEVEPGILTRFNDGKCDSKGRLWAGTMALETSPGVFSDDEGSLYSLDSKNSLTQHEKGFRISNGLGWDKANRYMYYVDSFPRKIYVFDYDEQSGTISNKKTLVDFNKNKEFENFGLPDGLTLDTDDKLWVACFNGGCILCIDPNTGSLVQSIRFPCQNITSCAWGGKNYDELYVTSGWFRLTEEEKKKNPAAGAVFKVTGPGLKGLAPQFYSN